MLPFFASLFLLTTQSAQPVSTTELPEVTSVALQYSISLPVPPAGVSKARVWLPVPRDDAHQVVLLIDSPPEGTLKKDAATGNRFLYFEYAPADKLPREIVCRFHIQRRAERPTLEEAEANDQVDLLPYLQPARLLPVDGTAKTTSDEIVGEATTDLEKARLIYKYVFDHMQYDKSEPGWGNADFARACEVGKGNCTDFHGLFLALCRAQGIPAKFEVGVELAVDSSTTVPGAYHCWAWFHSKQRGWIPVDISTAWKRSQAARAAGNEELAKQEMHAGFGWLDAYRVSFSQGLDVSVPSSPATVQRFIIDPVILFDDQPIQPAPVDQGGFVRTWSYEWLEASRSRQR